MNTQGRQAPARERSGRLWWLATALPLALACESGQRMAELGDFPVASGEVVRDCRIGYRTFGRLDATRSNAVVLLPWFLGSSRELGRQVGRGRLIDSSRYFVIALDALGNGVSSSPSNSRLQPGDAFPRLSIRDLVESEHRVLTSVLHLTHVRAVVGISMGGLQTFEWITAYPDYMDAAIPIAGSPRLPPEDRARWLAAKGAVASHPSWRRALAALRRGAPLGALRELGVDAGDYARHADAMIGFDAAERFGGSMARAIQAVRARLLVVAPERDEAIAPGPATAFARDAGAELLTLDGRCGHSAPSCERRTLWPAMAAFLEEGTAR